MLDVRWHHFPGPTIHISPCKSVSERCYSSETRGDPEDYICGRCGKKGHLDSLWRSTGIPLHRLEAQDYSHPQSPQSEETLKDYEQTLGTAQYSTPHFMSKEELPQMTCNSLKTVQVSRLGANEQSEHI